jgi:nucleoside-diphosphate-sugar epimerase
MQTNTRSTALVTGATGFVGSHLCSALLRLGWKVDCIVRPTSSGSLALASDAHFASYEYAGKPGEIAAIVERSKPDIVFHLASYAVGSHSCDDVPKIISANISLGVELVDAMTTHEIKFLVNTGTFWQHFGGSAYSPVSLYAASKQAFEDLLQYYVELEGLQVVTLKLFDTYGPNDQRNKILNLIKNASMNSIPLEMSAGDQLIDLVHVDDVVAAYLCAARRLLGGQTTGHEKYGIASGMPLSLKQLVKLYNEVANRPVDVKWGALPYRVREPFALWQDFCALPGWMPQVSLSEGLRQFVR